MKETLKEILKGILRFTRCLVQFLIIELPLQLVGAVVLLVYLPIHFGYLHNDDTIYDLPLPRYLRWFDCVDFYVGRNTDTIWQISQQGILAYYNWLAWRNPINYFGYKVLGFQFPDYIHYNMSLSSAYVGDSTGKREGWRYTEIQTGHYEYLLVKKVTSKSCIYLRFGWKIGEYNKPRSWCQQVFTISYRSYSGL